MVLWARKPDSLTAIWGDCLENVGASTSHNPVGLHFICLSARIASIHYRVHKIPQPVPILSQMNPVLFFKIQFNISLPSTPRFS
jgi:hypothetical protein